MNQKLNVFDIENARGELAEKTCLTTSVNQKVYLYFNYFQKIFETENQNIIEAFLKEFLDDYLNCISRFDVSGNDPDFTKQLITHLKNLSNYFRPSNDSLNLYNDIQRIETCYNKLVSILNGEESACSSEPKAYFPLIDKSHSDKVFGAIDSVTIRISKSSDGNKFIIVPSEKEIENKLLNQIQISWNLAIDLAKKYLSKLNQYHEVIVSFDKRLGFYEGNSLGTALTLSFLERLLKFYNPVYVINIRNLTAFTGGVDSAGKILSTSEEIIKQKVKTLFFSDIKCFVTPKCEENFAFDALTQLQKNYPKRKLKIIPVEDFSDVINRRDLVDVKRQKIIVRTGKFIRKNLISSAAIVLLSVLFAFLFVVDWDNNPSYVTADGMRAYIRNRNGKILWSQELFFDLPKIQPQVIKQRILIADINNDNKNEVIYTINDGRIIKCVTAERKELWRYKFKDLVLNKEQKLNRDYRFGILDTLTFMGKKSIYLMASNVDSYSSAIFRIDAGSGKRLPGTIWAAGHYIEGMLMDYDNDGKSEVISVGYDNGLEDLVFSIIDLDTLTKMRPTTLKYTLENIPTAEMEYCIRITKTDYDRYGKFRQSGYQFGTFQFDKEKRYFRFDTQNSFLGDKIIGGLIYQVTKDGIEIVVGSDFRIVRDSLVAHGKLKPPLTDTEEYKDIIKDNILYYKDGKWFTRKELDKEELGIKFR